MPAYWRDHPHVLRLGAVLVAALLVIAVEMLGSEVPRAVEAVSGDFIWRAGAVDEPERRVVVVDIDEASLARVGAWPWPRDASARLAVALQRAGAAVVVFDIVFADAMPGDEALADAWRGVPVVGGQIFSLDPAVRPAVGVVAGATADAACPPFAPVSQGYIANASSLMAAAPAVGHLTPVVERDGVVRRVPALVCHEGRAYPALPLAALWRAAQPGAGAGAPDWMVQPRAVDNDGAFWRPHARLVSASLPGVSVPVDESGAVRVPYRLQREAFTAVSAADVLAGTADAGVFRGAVVLVGATAFGIGDTVATPLAAVASGLEVHAQLLVGLLDHRLPYTPRAAPALQFGAALAVLAVLLAALRRGAPAKRLPLAGAALAAACFAGAAWALLAADLWLPWAPVAAFALLAAAGLATVELALARAQRERLSAHLGAYLPQAMARRLMASDPSGRLEMARREVGVLVADIRNFSAFAAHRPPEETAALLHAYCSIAVDVVEQHGGVVENVVGDAVLAVWNAYGDCPDHPARALAAASELLRATAPLLNGVRMPLEEGLVQPLALGIGLEAGDAIVGSFGPSRRRAHAALGEPVSVASRLQHMTQDLSIPILVGPRLAVKLPAEATEPLGDYLLEGLSRHYALHAPVAWEQLLPTAQVWSTLPGALGTDAARFDTRPPYPSGAGSSPRLQPGT